VCRDRCLKGAASVAMCGTASRDIRSWQPSAIAPCVAGPMPLRRWLGRCTTNRKFSSATRPRLSTSPRPVRDVVSARDVVPRLALRPTTSLDSSTSLSGVLMSRVKFRLLFTTGTRSGYRGCTSVMNFPDIQSSRPPSSGSILKLARSRPTGRSNNRRTEGMVLYRDREMEALR